METDINGIEYKIGDLVKLDPNWSGYSRCKNNKCYKNGIGEVIKIDSEGYPYLKGCDDYPKKAHIYIILPRKLYRCILYYL